MPDSPAPWSPPEKLDDHPYRFVPVPRAASRRDGWSSDRQHAFIAALARVPSVAKAAASVGMTARSAYRLRGAKGAEAFAVAWDDALEIGIWRTRDTAIERAIDGVAVPVVRRGRVVGTQTRYNDRLLLGAMANGTAETKGLLVQQQEIAHRRAIRDADARLGGPADWGPTPRQQAAADRRAQAKFQKELDAYLANPAPPPQPHLRIRPL
jgi:hypothetical protein